jgi:hypothetical protein
MTGEDLRKTNQIKILQRLSALKLINIDAADFSDPEALIQLYPSIALSVDRDGIDELLAILTGKGGTLEATETTEQVEETVS